MLECAAQLHGTPRPEPISTGLAGAERKTFLLRSGPARTGTPAAIAPVKRDAVPDIRTRSDLDLRGRDQDDLAPDYASHRIACTLVLPESLAHGLARRAYEREGVKTKSAVALSGRFAFSAI